MRRNGLDPSSQAGWRARGRGSSRLGGRLEFLQRVQKKTTDPHASGRCELSSLRDDLRNGFAWNDLRLAQGSPMPDGTQSPLGIPTYIRGWLNYYRLSSTYREVLELSVWVRPNAREITRQWLEEQGLPNLEKQWCSIRYPAGPKGAKREQVANWNRRATMGRER